MAQGRRPTRRQVNTNSYDQYIRNGYYSYSSTAYKLAEVYEPEVVEQDEPREIRRRRPAPRRPQPVQKRTRKQKPQRGKQKTVQTPALSYEMAMEGKRVAPLLTIFMASILCLGVFAIVVSMARFEQRRQELRLAQNDLKTIQQENIELQATVYEGYDLAEIERRATLLGLRKPEEHQLVYVNVPLQSYTVQYDTEPAQEEASFNFVNLTSLFFED